MSRFGLAYRIKFRLLMSGATKELGKLQSHWAHSRLMVYDQETDSRPRFRRIVVGNAMVRLWNQGSSRIRILGSTSS